MSHYFQLNNIYICNLKGIPWFSKDISQKVVKFTSDFNEILRHEETLKDDEKLNILFIQNTYGYRSGIFGFATEFVADGLTSLFISTPPMKLQSFLNHNVDYFRQNNLQCNDFQIISGAISYLNRFIPFANYLYSAGYSVHISQISSCWLQRRGVLLGFILYHIPLYYTITIFWYHLIQFSPDSVASFLCKIIVFSERN